MLIVLASVAAFWALALVVISTQQHRMIFPAPLGKGRLPGRGKVLRIPTPAGEIAVTHFEGQPDSRTAVFFHGNGEEMADGEDWAIELQRAGFGVLLVEYPGYGLTKGSGPRRKRSATRRRSPRSRTCGRSSEFRSSGRS
ncbi:MAG: hypothetical protein QM765_46080 [Myxococcales bacterium]